MKIIKIENVNVLVTNSNRVIAFQYPGTDVGSQDPLKIRRLQLIVDRMYSTKEEVLGG